MAITKLLIPPGIKRDSTKSAADTSWYDANNVRWRDRYTETIGGWIDDGLVTLQGLGRGLHAWKDFSNFGYQCVGTTFKYYLIAGTNVIDITPERDTGSGTNTITTDGSTDEVEVEDTSAPHGASINDFVVFTAVPADVGGIPKEVFTDKFEGFQIYEIVDEDKFKVKVGFNSTSGASGGGAITLSYKIASGTSAPVTGSGYSSGPFGGDGTDPTEYGAMPNNPLTMITVNLMRINAEPLVTPWSFTTGNTDYIYLIGLSGNIGSVDSTFFNNKWWEVTGLSGSDPVITIPFDISGAPSGGGATATFYHYNASVPEVAGATRGWGSGSTESSVTGLMRIVSIDNFGEDLMFSNRGGPIYYYDTSANTSSGVPQELAVAVTLGSISGSSGTPTLVDSFVVSESNGHTIAFGVEDIGGSIQNKMLIRWSDRHNPFLWTPSSSNEAGGEILRNGSEILAGIATKEEIVVFTTSAVYSMRYVGYPEVYGVFMISAQVSLHSRNCAVAVDNSVFFMGNDQFYEYNGSIVPLSKDITSFVFENINNDNRDKIFTGVNSKFTEVLWFYPDGDSFECNRYVSYNWVSRVWGIGRYDMSALNESVGFDSDTEDSTYNRTSWQDKTIFDNPLSTYISDYDPAAIPVSQTCSLMSHEVGVNAQNAAMDVFVESGEVDISDGDRMSFFTHFIPDIKSIGLEESASDPTVVFTLSTRKMPGMAVHGTATITVDFSPNADSELDYTPAAIDTGVRGRGRQVSLRVSSSNSGYGWRLGESRINMRPDGRS